MDLARLTEAIDRDPADASLRVDRGIMHYDAGRQVHALVDFDLAVQLAPRDAPALLWRASTWVALAEGEDDDTRELLVEALADLDRCVVFDPECADAYSLRGVALHRASCLDEAMTDFRTALALGSDPVHYGLWLAAAARDSDRPEDSLAAVDRAIAAGAETAAAYELRGTAFDALADLPAARAAFDHAIRLEPRRARTLARRAQVWTQMGDAEAAVQDLTQAIEAEPTEASYYFDRAEAWSHVGAERRADEDYGRGVLLQIGESTEDDSMARRKLVYLRLREHFGELELEELTVHERRFPRRVRADVQHALDGLAESRFQILDFTGLASEHEHMSANFSRIAKRSRYDPVVASAPRYEDVDVGTDAPVRCLVSGLWLLEVSDTRIALLLLPPSPHGPEGHHFQIAVPEGATEYADELFAILEGAVAEARCYRGKVLSLETCQSDYSGRAAGIAVHRLPSTTRDEVILPQATLELLERNVFDFIDRRSRLRDLRMSTKKGLLFYGPPGTGKTHTIRYLASTLVGQTMLLITAEQIVLLDEYMILARLLQPAIVVIEDVDLIARDREHQDGAGTESLLNRLLNEMDGLRPDVDVLFILTTNRPESLEAALASRPGRIDQAIEFPRPDDTCRRRLAELYAGGLQLSGPALDAVVRRTEGASASFVRELMRRSAQFMLARGADREVEPADVEAAAREMVEVGGSLNRALLGA